MLQKVVENNKQKFLNFGSIPKHGYGTSIVFCYNAVAKATKGGKPYITVYMRDTQGVTIPGYVFDLKSPLIAGAEMQSIIGRMIQIEWTENYLPHVGLTLILNKVSVITDVAPDELALFTGAVPNIEKKADELKGFFAATLGYSVSLPFFILGFASVDYCQGRVGGLCEHYWRMYKNLSSCDYLSAEEYKQLVGTFLAYIYVHSNYVQVSSKGSVGVETVTALSDSISKLNAKLKLGPGVAEVVHMFFGYEPMDIYTRTVAALSEQVRRVDQEFSLYKTIPLTQEGNAGYGKIKRYIVESAE